MRRLLVRCPVSVVWCLLSVICFALLPFGLLTVGCYLLFLCRRLSRVVWCLVSVVRCVLSFVRCRLSFVRCPLSFVFCLLSFCLFVFCLLSVFWLLSFGLLSFVVLVKGLHDELCLLFLSFFTIHNAVGLDVWRHSPFSFILFFIFYHNATRYRIGSVTWIKCAGASFPF